LSVISRTRPVTDLQSTVERKTYMLVLVDVDGTVADLNAEWLRLYNEEWGDDLTPEELTDWDVTKFVLPEVGTRIYGYLDRPYLYNGIRPFPGAAEGVQVLRDMGHRVVFASAGTPAAPYKLQWLRDHGFNPGTNSEDFVAIYDKALLKGDLLIDDRYWNIWTFGDLRSILFNAPHNRSEYWHRRALDWSHVVNLVRTVTEQAANYA